MSQSEPVQVKVESPSPIRRELRVEVAAERVRNAMDRALDELSRRVRLPGFRHGKVPRKLLRSRFQRDIENHIVERFIPQTLEEALEQTGLHPLREPVVREIDLAAGRPLRFTASFEIPPVVDPVDYRGVTIEEDELSVTDEHVQAELDEMRDKVADFVPVEGRALQKGDYAVVDLRITPEGGETKTQDSAMIEVGASDFHPDFAANLLAMEPGDESSFTIRYGDDDPDPEARGKTVHYAVNLKAIKQKELPDLDDDFAQEVGCDDLAELTAKVRASLDSRLEAMLAARRRQAIADKLVPEVDVEVPVVLVEQQLDSEMHDHAEALQARGVDPKAAPIDWRGFREHLREPAVKAVKWQLLLDAIASKESIQATDEDVDEQLAEIAKGAGKTVDFVRSRFRQDRRLEDLRRSLARKQVVDFLIRNARIERR